MAEVAAEPEATAMPTNALRLFQLISPSLPTGAFTYSQGLEWAVEEEIIHDLKSLKSWLTSIMFSAYQELEIPLLKRLYLACETDSIEDFQYWAQYGIACRETKELRLEEENRGRAMTKIIKQLEIEARPPWLEICNNCQIAGYALAAHKWEISLKDAALGYTWSWLENMVMAAVKIVPLGQSDGQKVLLQINKECMQAVEVGLQTTDDDIHGSCPQLTMASSLHETQYTRLFRS